MEVTVARWNWERFKAGEMDALRQMNQGGLENVYGRKWRKEAVRLKIEEVGAAETPEAKGDNCG